MSRKNGLPQVEPITPMPQVKPPKNSESSYNAVLCVDCSSEKIYLETYSAIAHGTAGCDVDSDDIHTSTINVINAIRYIQKNQ